MIVNLWLTYILHKYLLISMNKFKGIERSSRNNLKGREEVANRSACASNKRDKCSIYFSARFPTPPHSPHSTTSTIRLQTKHFSATNFIYLSILKTITSFYSLIMFDFILIPTPYVFNEKPKLLS